MARFDAFDNALVSIAFLAEEDAVAGDDDIAGVSGEGAQDAADGAGEFFAGFVAADLDIESDEADDASASAGCFIDDAQELVTFCADADHGASSEQISPRGDSFGERGVSG
jgi:hypothetical protein